MKYEIRAKMIYQKRHENFGGQFNTMSVDVSVCVLCINIGVMIIIITITHNLNLITKGYIGKR